MMMRQIPAVALAALGLPLCGLTLTGCENSGSHQSDNVAEPIDYFLLETIDGQQWKGKAELTISEGQPEELVIALRNGDAWLTFDIAPTLNAGGLGPGWNIEDPRTANDATAVATANLGGNDFASVGGMISFNDVASYYVQEGDLQVHLTDAGDGTGDAVSIEGKVSGPISVLCWYAVPEDGVNTLDHAPNFESDFCKAKSQEHGF